MLEINFSPDEWMKRTEKFREELPNVGKKMMTAVFTRMRQEIRNNIRANFKRDRGFLLNNLNYYAFKDFGGGFVSMHKKNRNTKGGNMLGATFYASFLEHGVQVTAKNKYVTVPVKDGGAAPSLGKKAAVPVKKGGAALSLGKKAPSLEKKVKKDYTGISFRKVKSFLIPPRPFFEPVINAWFGGKGTKAEKMMDEVLQKEINKYIEKKGSGASMPRDSG
jgi:hypothetical protein